MTDPGGAPAQHSGEIHLLVAKYREDAFRLARHLVRSTAEAEDLAHTAILNVLRRADHISDADHVRPYLMAAVRNAWRNQLRARGDRRFLGTDFADGIASTDMAPDDEVMTGVDVRIASAALETLSPTSREIIRLRYMEDMSFPDVAGRLAISSVAARQRAHRAREEFVGACMESAARAGQGECGTVRSKLGRYHRGLLSRKKRAAVATHLSGCRGCRTCYEQLIEMFGHRITKMRSGREEA
ncbi:MAG: sigma-70 family RNA polymerase sigma factor [Actinobacteria bacterium]|nr:sigma-70 family RNA polymerase sigma factor [Actinomycetota bacterium]